MLMARFLVTYHMPYAEVDQWMKLPEAQRKDDEAKMTAAWNTWKEAHTGAIKETAGVGKPKRVTTNGVEETRNDLMMYSFVEAETLEKVAQMFADHPHIGIMGGWIDVMQVNTNIG